MWFLLIASVFFLVLGFTHLDTAKPAVLAFWALIGVVSAVKLFAPKRVAGK
jgi:hypothetical protein